MNRAGRDDRTLIRIAAVLVALAVLAERAAGRSLPVRWLVLCILRRAEAVTHAFIVEAMPVRWPCLGETFENENRPIDAAWLAWRFRLFAAVLYALMRLARRPGSTTAVIDCPPRRLPPTLVIVMSAGGTLKHCDTS